VQDNGRWHLTDIQGFLVAILIVIALFLAAMAWGSASLSLLLAAAALLILDGLLIFLLGLGHNARRKVVGIAEVLHVNTAPPVGIVGRADLQLRVEAEGKQLGVVRFKDPSVAIVKWPRVRQRLPIEVKLNNPKQLRILWDQIDQVSVLAPMSPYYSYPATTLPIPVSPVPTMAPQVFPHIDFAKPTDPTDHPDREVITGVIVEPGQITAGPSTEEGEDGGATVRSIPAPRRPDAARPVLGGMLAVSNVERSVAFYRDKVGFAVVDSAPGGAILEFHGARLLLQPGADAADAKQRRVVHLHFEVPNIDAEYAELLAAGVQFESRPKEVWRGDTGILWKVVFHDPDQHGVGLIEWRQRDPFD